MENKRTEGEIWEIRRGGKRGKQIGRKANKYIENERREVGRRRETKERKKGEGRKINREKKRRRSVSRMKMQR